MIVKIDEIGKKFYDIMKEKRMSAHTLSIRTGIAESSLSNFFHDMSFKRCFNVLSELARVFNITSITIIFDKSLNEEDFKKLPENKDYFDTKIFLPEYKKEFLRLVERNEQAKQKLENIKIKNHKKY